jgi:hypothetical protein
MLVGAIVAVRVVSAIESITDVGMSGRGEQHCGPAGVGGADVVGDR